MADSPSKTKKVAQAATGVINIVVVGTAAVGAVALHSWAVAALGGVAYGALVAWDLATGKGQKHAGSAPSAAARLGAPGDYEDPATQAAVRTIVGARREINKVLEDTPADVQGHLALALLSVDELEERAANLAQRAEDLARFLKTSKPGDVEKDVRALAQRVSQTGDRETRAQYESAHQARKEHLMTLYELGAARERVHASLLSIAATLEGLPPKIVRMRTLDAQAMDKLTGDVKDELERMNGELRTFEETLKSLAEVGRS